MKKLSVLSLLLLLFITSCKAPVYILGMTENEFNAGHRGSTELVEKSAERTIYKRTFPAWVTSDPTHYFYFVNGKLVLIDDGTQRKHYIIVEHTSN
ncbi:hypothetical protein G7092_10275 [Mucilaginibacter sp. HC2]|uniref:hypothetical protein n=1 Tax=Mucilaginibacter inviolabilis TaxID=2714892 RepID=UPI00140B0E75|nr:hypothetical protein [Mucilaginibacter inviolabilis]NHA04183.1 hypothetical protein [Mucilaginibacter inviolabilis]